MTKTKIVCTIGPACANLDTLKKMMQAGMNVARFNMSHGTHESHLEMINLVKQARYELGLPVAIMLDTKGPEIRIKQFENGSVNLEKGQSFALTTQNVVGDDSIVSVTYDKLPTIVKKGTKILLNDGLIELEVVRKTEDVIHTKVVVGGKLSNNKSINIPSVELNMEYLSKTDKSDLEFGAEVGVDIYSISFVNTPKDVEAVRKYLNKVGVENPFIISKIESAKGVENVDKIIEVSDGIMVARGDMGVEIAFEKLPHIQKDIIAKAKALGKITITATQMLESMIVSSRPTRAEISDVANAIYDGTSAIMLSGETSAGAHPVLVIKTMKKIAEETESVIDYASEFSKSIPFGDTTCGIGYASCALASSLNSKAILVSTSTGLSALSICRFRPNCNIIALTPSSEAFYKLGMFWGVTPILDKVYYNTDELLASARQKAKENKLIKKGDVVVQTAGVMPRASGSNMLVVSVID